MKTTRLLLLISLSVLLAACNLPRPQPTPVDDWVGTAAAQTVAAIQTQLIPAETVTPVAATSTNAPPVSTAALITTVPCDRAEFVSDETIPDYTTLAPGEVFIKTWRLKNIGTCTWTNAYRVVFESGNALGAPRPHGCSRLRTCATVGWPAGPTASAWPICCSTAHRCDPRPPIASPSTASWPRAVTASHCWPPGATCSARCSSR